MNKRTVGVLAGLTLASIVVAASPAAQAITSPEPAAAAKVAAVKASAVKTVRTVSLSLPASADVGSNVTGIIQVIDTTGQQVVPVAGAIVALQEKRGNTFVVVSDDVTDESGTIAVAFTSRYNTTYRPLLESSTGPSVAGKAVTFLSTANVNWAARPDMDLPHGTVSPYAFRVDSEVPLGGYLEIAKASAPTKWTKSKLKATLSKDGVIRQSIAFPSAGQWLLRGTSLSSSSNAGGHTTTIPIVVR